MSELAFQAEADDENPVNPAQARQRQILALEENANQLVEHLQHLPRYSNLNVDLWIAENHRWYSIVRALDILCQNCRDAYPQLPHLNVTHRETYPVLPELVNSNLCAASFNSRFRRVASNFRVYKILFGLIPDQGVRNGFLALADRLSTASQNLDDDLDPPVKNEALMAPLPPYRGGFFDTVTRFLSGTLFTDRLPNEDKDPGQERSGPA